MRLVGKRDSEDLQYFVNAPLQFHIMLHYFHKAVSDYGTIDLDSYGILRNAPEFLDFKVLLNPFEEKFDAPSVAIQLANQLGFDRKIVRQKYVDRAVIIGIDDFPEFFGIRFGTFIPAEIAGYIRYDSLGKPSFPGPCLYSNIGFRPQCEESSNKVYLIKVGVIIVTSIEDIMRTRLIGNLWHGLRVVNIRRRNMHKSRDLCLNVVKRVHLNTTLMLAELRPLEHRKTQINRGRVEGIDMPLDLEDFVNSALPRLLNHELGIVLDDMIVTLLVGFAKIASGDGCHRSIF